MGSRDPAVLMSQDSSQCCGTTPVNSKLLSEEQSSDTLDSLMSNKPCAAVTPSLSGCLFAWKTCNVSKTSDLPSNCAETGCSYQAEEWTDT